jgi:hypothetical protein
MSNKKYQIDYTLTNDGKFVESGSFYVINCRDEAHARLKMQGEILKNPYNGLPQGLYEVNEINEIDELPDQFKEESNG